jgi:hypothetical protein
MKEKSDRKIVKHVRVPIHKINNKTLEVKTEWHPIATIVAIDRDKFGVAVCSKHDSFSKKRGVEIATARAVQGKDDFDCSSRQTFSYPQNDGSVKILNLDQIVYNAYADMVTRASKYFAVEEKPAKAKRNFVRNLIRPWSK